MNFDIIEFEKTVIICNKKNGKWLSLKNALLDKNVDI